ncbi:MAG: aspartate kinase [Planctomycetota bacterium]
MIIMKFGGTSLGDADRIKGVCRIVKSRLKRKPVVVVSAIGQVTDHLFDALRDAVRGTVDFDRIHNTHSEVVAQLGLDEGAIEHDFNDMKRILVGISYLKELSPRVEDMFVSYGERLSARIVAAYFNKEGIPARLCPAFEYGLLTDSNYGKAAVLPEAYAEIVQRMAGVKEVPVITGYIGRDRQGNITTLGRGGSDYTAAVYGAALGAEEIQIWTDVTGVMTADPTVVKEAVSIPHLSFAEAGELAYYGARVLHPNTIVPAMEKGIRVRVLNTFAPEEEGTAITAKATKDDHKAGIKSIAYKENQTLVNIASPRMFMAAGFLERIAHVFGQHRAVIDMISTSETTVSLTVGPNQDMGPIQRDLEEFATAEVQYGKCILCVVGEGIPDGLRAAARMIGTLESAGVRMEMISQARIGINVSVLIDDKQIDKAVKALHKEFFEK